MSKQQIQMSILKKRSLDELKADHQDVQKASNAEVCEIKLKKVFLKKKKNINIHKSTQNHIIKHYRKSKKYPTMMMTRMQR